MSKWRRLRRLLCLLPACWPALLSAQVPAGPEFTVNTYTTGNQANARVAMGAGGSFVVAWSSPQDGSSFGIFAQRFAASGVPLGAEFRVNTYTTDFQYLPQIAMDATGGFVVVWNSFSQDGEYGGIFGQRFDTAGLPKGAEFRVNTYTTSTQDRASVAAGASGRFVVAWDSRDQDGSALGVFAQRFDGAGPLGTEFRVNTFTTGYQYGPSVAAGASGSFIVSWSGRGPSDNGGVFARRFDGAGLPLGAEFRVNTYTTYFQFEPSVATDAAGNFVVVWESQVQDGGGYGIVGQRFDAAGSPRGGEFLVNSFTTGPQVAPSVAADAEGNFVVAWRSAGQGDAYYGVFGQRFDAAGTRRGAEFHVNTYTAGQQLGYAVAADAAGNFVVTWRSTYLDGSFESAQAQRFGGLQSTALAVDGPGNSVWEPGELAEVKPTWRNFNGSPQAFGGLLSGITGPAGATYGIADNSASYGTVPNGTTASCNDCYVVLVSNPTTRPVQHWDASALETITPDAHGEVKRWRLHIGNSFTDVLNSSPFYRFVETLLHKGVTGGCGGTNYCPSTGTTRDQMSVFVLVAKEGAGYAPPACGTPVFTDVPASNPFCRYIEELARRGVVGGCGGGNYCPSSAVTRDQMSVFALRTLDPALNPPACTTPVFNDVPASNPFCKWIEEMARRGIVSGCGGGNYCPTQPVTREQMGVFISATFGLTLYGP